MLEHTHSSLSLVVQVAEHIMMVINYSHISIVVMETRHRTLSLHLHAHQCAFVSCFADCHGSGWLCKLSETMKIKIHVSCHVKFNF